STARSRSPSSSTTLADLPPSSSTTGVTDLAAFAATSAPALVDPVKETRTTPGCPEIAEPTIRPVPVTRLYTPLGNPTSFIIFATSWVLKGVASAGLWTTVQPAASAGAP